MFLFRASSFRTRISYIKESRRFLSLSKNYSTKTEEKYLKLLKCLGSRFGDLRYSSINISHYRTFCSRTFSETSSIPSDVEQDSPSSSSVSFYTEHPDVASRSEEEVEKYRKAKSILVKGSDVPKPITKFSELCLPDHLSQVLRGENYSEPTAIQSQGWPVAFSCRDMVGVSQTGSGKTLAYMLPAVVHATERNLDYQARSHKFRGPAPKVLVLGPTRELVQQIQQVSGRFLEACHLRGACVYGGASRIPQLRNLQRAQICIATPGRLLDYIDNQEINLKNCTYLVLDEADRMLDMGFEPQIRDILEQIPNNRQTLMWSATWPREIRSLAEDFLNDYIHITVGNTELVANPNILQNIYVMDEDEKFDKFHSLLQNILAKEDCKILVFAETKRKVDSLTHLLKKRRIDAWGIHGDCTQNRRDSVLYSFRNTTPSVLIATDIASRGLDISDIRHVINYDFPNNIEDYVHRIGRTARGSATGESHSFFKPENTGLVKELVSVLKKSNQEIDPDLLSLASKANANNFQKPQRRYSNNYNRPSYTKNRMYTRM